MGNQKVFILSGIILSIIIILSAASLAINRFSYSGRAQDTASQSDFSRENSYLFASPISAPSDSKSIIRITVFILNSRGLGANGLRIKLKVPPEVEVNEIQPITDSFGRATFDLTCQTSGNYTIAADIQEVALPQTVSISFR